MWSTEQQQRVVPKRVVLFAFQVKTVGGQSSVYKNPMFYEILSNFHIRFCLKKEMEKNIRVEWRR